MDSVLGPGHPRWRALEESSRNSAEGAILHGVSQQQLPNSSEQVRTAAAVDLSR